MWLLFGKHQQQDCSCILFAGKQHDMCVCDFCDWHQQWKLTFCLVAIRLTERNKKSSRNKTSGKRKEIQSPLCGIIIKEKRTLYTQTHQTH